MQLVRSVLLASESTIVTTLTQETIHTGIASLFPRGTTLNRLQEVDLTFQIAAKVTLLLLSSTLDLDLSVDFMSMLGIVHNRSCLRSNTLVCTSALVRM